VPLPWRAGHIITARRLNAALGVIVGRVLTQAGTYFTTSAATVADLPKLTISDLAVTAGRWYEFSIRIQGNASVANDQFSFKVRTAAAGGTVLAEMRYQVGNVTAFTDQKILKRYWKAPTTNSAMDFYVSVERTAGSGTLAIHGQSESYFSITDVGDVASIVEVP
jgi:hypothetical protein